MRIPSLLRTGLLLVASEAFSPSLRPFLPSKFYSFVPPKTLTCGKEWTWSTTPEVTTRCLRLRSSESDNDNVVPSSSSNSAGELEFEPSTAFALVGGQSLVVVAAVLIAWLAGTPGLGLGEGFGLGNAQAWQTGTLAVVPLGILAWALDIIEDQVPALQRVTKATQRSVLTLLGARFLPLVGLLVAILLGIAAGVGEEWLFRGVLQTELWHRFFENSGGPALAVALSSVIFGALHAVTPLYAFLATLASLYFGFLYVWTDNLAVAMVCHAVYDIGALYYAHWTVAKDLTPQQRNDLLRLSL